jgi:hypothetical protein
MDDKNNNSYYECKRCFYKSYQKNDMKKHLDKKNLCLRSFESYKYKDEDLYDLSLHRIKTNIKNFTCINCNKNFSNNNNLKRHIEKSCKQNIINNKLTNNISIKSEDIINLHTDKKLSSEMIMKEKKNINEENDTENIPIEASEILDFKNESIHIGNNSNSINSINSINNINSNNINISINITKSFDEEWDLSQIDINKKIILLLNNAKFTSTLENILENEVNLNVLIDSTSDNGLVFEDNKLVNMNVKEIVKKTMDKLHKHLNDMHNDVMNPNIFNLDNKIFGNELTKINKKYTDFIESKTTQQNVKEYITDIYNKKKTNTVTYIENKGY